MELVTKRFEELTVSELYEIIKLRVDIFVVEQNCPYYDLDDHDQNSIHLFLRDEDGIEAYLRVLPAGETLDTPAIGRVVVKKRRIGLGTELVKEGVAAAVREFGAAEISLEAQVYARGLYEKCGFRQSSEEFLEDGIPHIRMTRKI